MSRPKPTNIMKQQIGRSHRQISINQTNGFWIVVLDQDTAINIVSDNVYGFDTPKYVKNGWANEHSAQTLCAKLNHWFNTDRFRVLKVL